MNVEERKTKRVENDREAESTDEDNLRVQIPDTPDKWLDWRKLWAFTGPGFLMSIAYLDPGNIESDLQSGALADYRLIWVLLGAHILGLLMQRQAARIGVVTGRHMAEIAHDYYTPVARIVLWLMVEIAIVGSDMQEVIGTAISLYLLSHKRIPLYAGVLITVCDTFSFMFLERYGVRKFEAFFCFLIACMAASFGYEFTRATPPATDLLKGTFFPFCSDCDLSQWTMAVAIVGAVIMPHNFYLHSALVKSRSVNRHRSEKIAEANKYFFIESTIALACSFVINLLVVGVFAAGLYNKTNGDVYATCLITDNGMPMDYINEFNKSLTDTAPADIYHGGLFLGCTFGIGALYVWAVGILAAGQSSTMTGTYAGQFAMEGFIKIRLPTWKRIIITRSIAIIPTLAVVIFANGLSSVSDLNDLLNAVMMLQLPFALIPALTFVSNRQLMGEFACGRKQQYFLLTVSLIICLINIYFLGDYVNDNFGFSALSVSILTVIAIFYVLFCLYLTYYCLEAMGIVQTRVGSRLFPAPVVKNFDRPWARESDAEKGDDEKTQQPIFITHAHQLA